MPGAGAALQVHFSVRGNLLNLFMRLLAHGGPRAVAELRRQGVGQVVGLAGPRDPAWLALRPLAPLQQ